MNEIKWECPLCGNENNEQITDFFDKDYSINHFNCKECNEEVITYIEYKPVLISVDLV